VALAALHVAHEDPDAVMAVLPADHHIADPETFRTLLSAAAERAAAGDIVTLGIRPTRPETGYGYIEFGDDSVATGDGVDAYAVERFVEKPDRPTAEKYLENGKFLWNSGMFFFTPRRILEEFQRFLPQWFEALQPVAEAIGTDAYDAQLTQAFDSVEGISLDYGIMEPVTTTPGRPPVRVIPAQMGWNDVGHWAALEDFVEKDGQGNVVIGDAMVLDGRGNIVRADGPTVALVGVDDLVVVSTGDAILVCPRDRAQDVRRIVEQLESDDRKDLL
jgi:mannose-1-phosphate guanylyltransferase